MYSLGLSLYELLVLRVPFESADRLHLIEQIKNDEPTRPRAIDPRIPRDLETIVLKAIEKDPKRRYATAAELGEDLQRFIEGAPIRARRVGELERLWMLARRHRTAAVLLTLFLVALAAGTAFSTVFAIRAARERDKAIAAGAEAKAVLDFLKNDLLAQAGSDEQGSMRPDIIPQPNLTVRKLLDRAAERIAGKFQGQPLVEATIRETIGIAYTSVESLDTAERNLARALDPRRREQGETAPETLSVMNQLHWLYGAQIDLNKAEPLGRKTLELSRKALGQDHPITRNAIANLAETYIDHYKDREAEPLAIEYLDTCRRVVGEDHLETAEIPVLAPSEVRRGRKALGFVSNDPPPHFGKRTSRHTEPEVPSRKSLCWPRQVFTGRARAHRGIAGLSTVSRGRAPPERSLPSATWDMPTSQTAKSRKLNPFTPKLWTAAAASRVIITPTPRGKVSARRDLHGPEKVRGGREADHRRVGRISSNGG